MAVLEAQIKELVKRVEHLEIGVHRLEIAIEQGVLTSPPVSDFLSVGLAVAPQVPPLPELAVA